ncbi:MAG: hypothetical protein JWP19_593 [Rhodoglobus sp.]|nr:hypothetical protein [Rhodoglobus sp.]
MRFILAIVSFVLAAVMIGYGIAQRTILAEPDEVAVSSVISSTAAVTVIDGATLNAFAGSQTLTINGSDQVFAAYGRTSDVLAWVGDTTYNALSFDSAAGAFASKVVPGAEKTVPDPNGSDLWIDDYKKTQTLTLTVNVPEDISFVIVSDGTQPAPSSIRLSWPLDNSTPWSGPLILGGAIALILGLGLLLWATNHMRSGRGPRRKPQKLPKVPRKRSIKGSSRRALPASASGRRRGMIAVPLVLASAIALSACTTNGAVPAAVAPSPSASASNGPDASAPPPPAVSTRQVARIISRISAVATKADATRDATLLATRFSGAALELRLANYAIRGADGAQPGLAAIPDGPVKLVLPQQTDLWPRTVLAVIQDAKDNTIPPLALFLVQVDARSDYKVSYAITLEPSAKLDNLAPANIGAPRLDPDSNLLKMSPTDVALAYGDILEKDVDSPSYLDFEKAGDSLRTSVGLANKQQTAAALPATAKISFGHMIGPADAIALATNDAGAIIAVNLNETTTVAPVEAGAAVNPTGAVKALSGVAVSTKGVVATYGDQLLFYVPPAGSDGKIILLGYSQGLVSAKELG